MHGREGEDRKRSRHMWSVSPRGTTSVGGSSSTSSLNCFFKASQNATSELYSKRIQTHGNVFPEENTKEGRKISIGDCALFKPPQDSPPFIGIIRWFTSGKENNLKLGVNWLYRPSEVKLGKGILLEAAPNEVFYSFHKDEIPAASLLHPCKVAFLPKGAELPSGVSSFVCRRVYDIANKCLWWITDQDYIDERQEEVDQLIYKTRIEMHATVQPGGRSPKPINGTTSTSQLKSGSDSVQNVSSSFPSQVKGKKRERGDHGSEPMKRERSSKIDDGDSGHLKSESILKFEIAKITEKGGLVDSELVEKLIQLMHSEKVDKKIDLADRSMLAGVIAATDKFDCLNRFVQLKGLPVLDEWLQEIHRGKIGDASSHKDIDKAVEEFLLVLLRALDKLPVNLHALQMCNIGKSVNLLRTNKNLEIQKKARSLVDTWKKRVEAEMNMNDGKSGSNQAVSWPARSRLPEVSQGGNRHTGGSEVAMRSSATQVAASKTTSAKIVQGEIMGKSSSASLGSTKSAPSPASLVTNLKDVQSRTPVGGSSPDLPLTTATDEKSSSSSQSHNSQSCSSDHVKTPASSGKEDARRSTAGSMSVNKISGGPSRHRKSISGLLGPGVSGAQRESGSSRSSSFHRNTTSEKLSHSGLTSEKALDMPVVDVNSHKLILKIPNRGRGPAQSASGGSFDDPSIMSSRASSPMLSEKLDQFDRNLKEKNDAYRANITADANNESWQSNDVKDVLTGSDEGGGSPDAIPDEQHCRAGDDTRKMVEISKAASSSSGNELKSGKGREASFSSMNALIDSCVKYSEAKASMSVGDDVGMNLLASVAAGEMSKCNSASPAHSPQSTPTVEDSCMGNSSKSKSAHVDNHALDQRMPNEHMNGGIEKQSVIPGTLLTKAGYRKSMSHFMEDKRLVERNEVLTYSNVDTQQTAMPCMETCQSSDEAVASVGAYPVSIIGNASDSEVGQHHREKKAVVDEVKADVSSDKSNVSSSSMTESKANNGEAEMEAVKGLNSNLSADTGGKNQNNVNTELNNMVKREQKPPALIMHQTDLVKDDEERLFPSDSGAHLHSENIDDMKAEKSIETDSKSYVNDTDKQKIKQESNGPSENQIRAGSVTSAAIDQKSGGMEENLERKEDVEHHSGGEASDKISPSIPSKEKEQSVMSSGSRLSPVEADKTPECASTTADVSISATGVTDMEAKLEFDLNEGFNGDEGKYAEQCNMTAASCSSAVNLISPMPFPVSSVTSGLPASITVAAAAKGPFVPPEDLLRSKGELGWKGSAATSAFRPAEPRKVLDMPLNTTNVPVPDATTSKHSRPLLDFDLNVPDERMLDDIASQHSTIESGSLSVPISNCVVPCHELVGTASVRCPGGLDLDLNRLDEATDMGQYSGNNRRRVEVPLLPAKSSSGGLPNGELSVRRDFDLNNGPILDEVGVEPASLSQHARSSIPLPSQLPVSSLRMNNADLGGFSAWFPPGNSYSAVTIPSVLPDRGDQSYSVAAAVGSQRVLGAPAGGTAFGPDVYRGPVLSSSPAVPFHPSPFQYPVFPFGTSFPIPSATLSGGSTTYMDSSSGGRLCFPTVNSPFLAPAGAVSSSYPRPYVVGLPDCNNGGVESGRKWGRQGLDLNAGPGGPEIEGRDEASPFASRQHSVASSHALAEEQARMYQMGGGILKRKEPEGGWDTDRYKQSSWQ